MFSKNLVKKGQNIDLFSVGARISEKDILFLTCKGLVGQSM